MCTFCCCCCCSCYSMLIKPNLRVFLFLFHFLKLLVDLCTCTYGKRWCEKRCETTSTTNTIIIFFCFFVFRLIKQKPKYSCIACDLYSDRSIVVIVIVIESKLSFTNIESKRLSKQQIEFKKKKEKKTRENKYLENR